MKLLAMALVAALVFSGCQPKGEYKKFSNDPFLYSKTVKKLNDVVLENNFPPMIGSRNYAYANIAAYECVVAGDASYQTLAGQIKHLPELPKPEAGKEIDYSLAALLAFTKVGNAVTFPEGSMMGLYDALKKELILQVFHQMFLQTPLISPIPLLNRF
ncbi:MAG: hypothetical protein IPP79_03145 [Chitinophagaceae bacterium]|nr:hypothetical protein [Chitinophagaceae bacterium]